MKGAKDQQAQAVEPGMATQAQGTTTGEDFTQVQEQQGQGHQGEQLGERTSERQSDGGGCGEPEQQEKNFAGKGQGFHGFQ